jgi:hypothetical protein
VLILSQGSKAHSLFHGIVRQGANGPGFVYFNFFICNFVRFLHIHTTLTTTLTTTPRVCQLLPLRSRGTYWYGL